MEKIQTEEVIGRQNSIVDRDELYQDTDYV